MSGSSPRPGRQLGFLPALGGIGISSDSSLLLGFQPPLNELGGARGSSDASLLPVFQCALHIFGDKAGSA